LIGANVGFGMQKSCTASGSEANVIAMFRENIGSKSQKFFCINILC
jgi:hypothetical protein